MDKHALGTSEVGRVSAWCSPCKSLLYALHLQLFHSQVSFPCGGGAVTVPGFTTVQSDFQRRRVSLLGTFSWQQGLLLPHSWHLIGLHWLSCSFWNNPMAKEYHSSLAWAPFSQTSHCCKELRHPLNQPGLAPRLEMKLSVSEAHGL